MPVLEFIKKRGVSKQSNPEQRITKLLNLLSFYTAVGALSISIVSMLVYGDIAYASVSLFAGLAYSFLILLHHFGKIKEARLFFSTIAPLWYVYGTLMIGGFFSQSIVAAANIALTWLLFRKQKSLQKALLSYNLLLYIIPTAYVIVRKPFYGVHDYPLDEIVVFLLCLGWLSIVFAVYESTFKDHIKKLKEKNKELRRTAKELETFNYIASHDLKSPLRNIISFMHLIKRDIDQENFDTVNEYLSYAETGAYHMHEIIEGIMDISTIDNTQPESEHDLNQVLSRVIKALKPDIENRNGSIYTEHLPSYYCNESDFVSVFQNLIQNAFKYNESQKPTLKIRCVEEDGCYVITFRDNGIGIPEKYHDQIFEFFKRLHSTDEYPGTGLGLGLCKKIATKYGGSISVRSRKGLFTTFLLRLPKQESGIAANTDDLIRVSA